MPDTEIKVPDALDRQLSPLVRQYLAERDALAGLQSELSKREITPMTAQLAVEYDTRAKAFEAEVTKAFEPTVAVLHNTHRAATAVRAKLLDTVTPLRRLCGSIMSRWAIEQEKQKQAAAAPAERAAIVERKQEVLAGISMVKVWKGEVTDVGALIKHVAENPAMTFLLQVRQSDLDDYITRMAGNVNLPGVKTEETFEKRNRNK